MHFICLSQCLIQIYFLIWLEWNYLYNYFDQKDKKSKSIDVNGNSAKFRVTYELDEETMENLSEFEIDKLAFDVELKRIDEENYIAEFTKVSGAKHDFYNMYDEFLTNSDKK